MEYQARIGVIVLSTNLTVEDEFRYMAPEGVSYHVSRCPIPDTTKDEQEKEDLFLGLGDPVIQAAKQVAMTQPDIILFACTVGSFLGEEDHHAQLSDMITQTTGIQSLTTASAVLEAIRSLSLRKITLISPYPEGTGVKEKEFLERQIPGLNVVRMKHLGVISSFEKNLIPLSTTYHLAKETVARESDGLFISCTALRTMEIIEFLERDLEIPVVTSTQASLWACLKRCHVKGSAQFGRLFDL